MHLGPVKGIALILLVLIVGVMLLTFAGACAPVDSEGNPMHISTSQEDTSDYKIIFGDEIIEGKTYKIVRDAESDWTEIYDVNGNAYFTSIDNILISED